MDGKHFNLRPNQVLWIDLEMSGVSSPTDDLILEVAAIVTDWDFKELATYTGVIKNKVSDLKRRMDINSAFWNDNLESKKAMLDQNKTGKSLTKIEDELLALIDKHCNTGVPVLLGGNSIHVDRRFIIEKWPRLNARLHYRMLDVSAWKVLFEGKFKTKFAKPNAHRALEDIRGSIDELKHYLTKLK